MEEGLGVWQFPFSSIWDTTKISAGSSNERQVKLPVVSSYFQSMTVDWGDGTVDNILTYNDSKLLHTYEKAGVYEITITGKSFGLSFNNGGDKLKIQSFNSWGGLELMIGGFHGCNNLNLSKVEGVPDNKIRNLKGLFTDCTSLSTINNIHQWDVSDIPNMGGMFEGATLFNQDISAWNFNVNIVLENFMKGKSANDYDAGYYAGFLNKLASCVIDKGRSQMNKKLHMGTIKYSSLGANARQQLIDDGWIITDGGQK